MTTTVLPRMEVDSISEEMQSFANRCKNELGYSALQVQVTKPLLRCLLGIEITPLDTEAVEKYKQSILASNRWKFRNYDWRITPLSNYQNPIPEFVLSKALQIHKAIPSAYLYVDRMIERQEEYPDPFLVVAADYSTQRGEFQGWVLPARWHGRFSRMNIPDCEYYYVEVWDEPKFEGRITK